MVRFAVLVVMRENLPLLLLLSGVVSWVYSMNNRSTVGTQKLALRIDFIYGERKSVKIWIMYCYKTAIYTFIGKSRKGMYTVCWYSSAAYQMPYTARYLIWGQFIFIYRIIVNIGCVMVLLKPFNKNGPS